MEAAPPSSSPSPPPQCPSSPPPPPEFPKQSLLLRYKLAWRVFMIANLGLGAYIFMMAKQKEGVRVRQLKVPAEAPPAPPAVTRTYSTETQTLITESDHPLFDGEIHIVPASPFSEPLKQREPIHEDDQREIFKQMLEEWRQIKPKDRAEKQSIDQEKAIIKKFLRSEPIPKF